MVLQCGGIQKHKQNQNNFELKKPISNEFSFNGYVAICSCTKIPVQCTNNVVQVCTLNINLLINQNSVSKIFDHQKIRAPKIWVPGRFAPNPVRPLSRFAPIPVRPGSVHICESKPLHDDSFLRKIFSLLCSTTDQNEWIFFLYTTNK